MASIMIGTLPVPLPSPTKIYKEVEELIEIETYERIYIDAKPASARKRPLCFCEDDSEGHYHCHFCSMECDSKNHLEEHERDFCEDAFSVRAFGYKQVPKIEFKKVIKKIPVDVPTKILCSAQKPLIIEPKHMAETSSINYKTLHRQLNHYSNTEIAKYNKSLNVLESFFMKDKSMQETLVVYKYSPIQLNKKGAVQLKPILLKKAIEKQQVVEKLREEEEQFQSGNYEHKEHIGATGKNPERVCSSVVSFKTPYCKRTPKKPRKTTRKTKNPPLSEILDLVTLVCKKYGKAMEFKNLGRRKPVKANFVKRNGGTVPKITLPHTEGRFFKQELQYESIQQILMHLCKFSKSNGIKETHIKPGDSGLVFDERSSITTNNTKLPHFVIRGRSATGLVSALEPIDDIYAVHHYSGSPEQQFFRGWKSIFDQMTPHTQVHDHTIDYTNEQCGAMAALICQLVYPVHKLSCNNCRDNLEKMSWVDYKQFVLTHMGCCENVLASNNTKGMQLIKQLVTQVTVENTNIEDSMEIVRLTQNYTTTQMLQIKDINLALMKGPSATQEEFQKATQQLLAMTRWWKNHMNLTTEDSLKIFRNKRSAKVNINPNLLCDNQLDKNGNFVWGERAYHAKRFFSNFFEEVIPRDGYSAYINRVNPNGIRELSIGALIVPLDFEQARLKLHGKPIKREPLTKACVSRQEGNFIYPCCCVTHDDGKPVYSSYLSPTKRHLVVGATGDPKYIDLPTNESERMYIAKEGYCYLNIFLAMLVNVNEGEAKDFTKMVRDNIVPRLGTWPAMIDVATAVHQLASFHPDTRNAELPRILVDHAAQTMHVIDSFGSHTTGYHILKAGTANDLIKFASNDLEGEMKFYKVGGTGEIRMSCEKALISSIFKPKRMIKLLEEDPYILLMGIVSPTILVHMFRMRHFEKGVEVWIKKNQSIAKIYLILDQLTRKVVMSDLLRDQLRIIEETAPHLKDTLTMCPPTMHSYKPATDLLTVFIERRITDKQLVDNGFSTSNEHLYDALEKTYAKTLKMEWQGLNWLEKSCATWHLKKFSPPMEERLTLKAIGEQNERLGGFVSACFLTAKTHLRETHISISRKCEAIWFACIKKFVNICLSFFYRCYSDILYLVNVCIIFSLLVQMTGVIRNIVATTRQEKAIIQAARRKEDENTIVQIYHLCMKQHNQVPTKREFMQLMEELRPDLVPTAQYMLSEDEVVSTQAKTALQVQFEKIIAVMALVTMCIDAERSDAIFRILSKLKTVFSTVGEDVRIQSLDDIQQIEDDKKLTIDFDLNTTQESSSTSFDVKFEEWWNCQLQQNRVVPHYRNTGEFIEFTRETAAKIANQIALSSSAEFLVRGAVGSGKSTGLPHHLSKKGRVLLLEPTRPLAENVASQLGRDPFYHNVTLRMRGLSKFGSSNITVMTSGYAFHYFVNNPQLLADFSFIVIDECHVLDSSTIAFNCALKEYEYPGKLLKVSATPPGRECEFTTQHPVKLKIEEHISFQNFVQAQGTNSNADMTQHGSNILVYVASYNEVDQLSKLLIERQYKVTKVDGRTMQMGNVEIITSGTKERPHFIVATNIIENGVTIDVDCVVDFGLKVTAELDSDNRCVRYQKKPVTYGERIQRLGRVGRFKAGFALRIGHTEKGIENIPDFIATEAAFLSFAYGLPVTTQSVSTSILSRCTVKQAKSALNFELTPFFTIHFIKYDGCMHPEIHKHLKAFKLRESEMMLSKLAIPHQFIGQWISVQEYERLGIRISCAPTTKIPFHVHGIPDKLFEILWEIVFKYKSDAGFGRLTSASVAKVSYTLSVDQSVLPRTIATLDHLLGEEMMKKNHFDTIGSSITGSSFSLAGIANTIRSRYMRDHSQHNISILQQAKAQLMSLNCTNLDFSKHQSLEALGILNTVCLQSKSEIADFLGLKGRWNGERLKNDIFLAVLSLIGGGWMIWEYCVKGITEPVSTQGKKRMLQKLKFRDARDRKVGREIYADDYTMEHTFGEAYSKRGKVKGSTETKGMGRKTRNFIHMYGVEPEEYSMIRFVDPLTGHTMDENTRVDIRLVQDEFGEIRKKYLDDEILDRESIRNRPGIEAYFLGKGTKEALKVDLTPHIPTVLCRNSNAIAGFPEREGELRQIGQPVKIALDKVPKANENVDIESKSVYRGLRDYNGIATMVCQLTNHSDGHVESIYGIGYGPYIITNGHLFKRNNGSLTVRTWHGEFVINNATQIRIHFIEGKDAIMIRMPKDFPPFCQKNVFRAPIKEERVVMVGTNFQEKSLRATVSESSSVFPEGKGSFWMHWITTQDGYCGMPLVSTSDGMIVGFHGLASKVSEKNFFVPLIDGFKEKYLNDAESLNWTKHWVWQPDKIAWGSLNLVQDQPKNEFRISKLITDLFDDNVTTQSKRERWVYEAANGNIKACGKADSSLVTKHVVKGRCPYFTQYLESNKEAKQFFTPLMGQYQPSKLNKEAFKKDFFKYSKPIVLNEVNFEAFEQAVIEVKMMMNEYGFSECVFVTDPDDIYNSLNMKAAVGAQYIGKKKDYFENCDEFAKERLLFKSCERLFYGQKGLWNGSLKAELRPIEKVQENKTRTFTAAPIDTLLGAKVCVDDFNNQFYSLNLKCPWTVGMTKFYGGWNELMTALPDGWLYCHADGSQFDSSLTPLLLNAVAEIRTFFMEEWWIGQEMLQNLYAEIVYTPILAPDGTIFKKFRGNNSGQPSTVVDNTLMVIISMYYACIKQKWNSEDIATRLVFFANGDDIILAVKKEDERLLDTLSSSFSELGLNYNFEERTTKREDLWFMSHKAIQSEGIYIPKLEQERIVSILEWDRSKELMHRTEAICAAMIEAWGYPELLTEIRKFYLWLLQRNEFKELASLGKAPYISEVALRKLYTNRDAEVAELQRYAVLLDEIWEENCGEDVMLQSGRVPPETVDAGADSSKKGNDGKRSKDDTPTEEAKKKNDRDVGQSSGGKLVPRLKKLTSKMSLPTVGGKVILSLDHLIDYKPSQVDLFNTRATKVQFESWYNGVKAEYELNDEQMAVVMNGFMVWCIDNGTSPDVNGVWVMMDGDEQVEYPLKPIVENAKPTLRQIMHHFSDAAEAYIEMRNSEGPYMPRYGLLRNLRDRSLARYAFDFYEVNSKTSDRAREAVAQMKAAALTNTTSRLFGLDGNVSVTTENTERHTARDVNQNMHTLLGMGPPQ